MRDRVVGLGNNAARRLCEQRVGGASTAGSLAVQCGNIYQLWRGGSYLGYEK